MISTTMFLWKTLFFIFGLLIGSFLNVLIYRIPRDLNIAFPRSSCPNCRKIIFWYENIPLVSYLIQRGRCNGCGESIGWLYPLIELFTGIVALYLAPDDITAVNGVYFVFYFWVMCIFIVHFVIDLQHQILPDSLNLTLFLIFLFYGVYHYYWTYWLSGALIGFLIPFLVTWIFYLITKKVGMGGGDLKLYACLGLYLGPLGIVYNISLSCLLGAIIGGLWLLIAKKSKNDPIPFGPFIIIVAIIQIFFHDLVSSVLQY